MPDDGARVDNIGDKVQRVLLPPMRFRFTLLNSEKKQIESFVCEKVFPDEVLFIRADPQESHKMDFRDRVRKTAEQRKKCIIVIPPNAEFLDVEHIGFADDKTK